MVTGGLGFIGANLCKRLLDDGHNVTALDNFRNGNYSIKNAQKLSDYHPLRFSVSRSDTEDLVEAVTSTDYDGIFHLAAIPRVSYSIDNPIETNNSNINGTVGVLEFAKRNKIPKVIFASSSSVYGDNLTPFDEGLARNPMSPYAIQKATGEDYMKFYNEHMGVKTVSLRFFNVYGPGQDPDHPYALLIAKALGSIKEGNPVPVYGTGTNARDYTYVDDVVDACIKAMTLEKNQWGYVFNIGAGKPYSVNEVLSIIQEYLPDKKVVIETRPARIEPAKTYAWNKRASMALGWEPKTDIRTGIKKCIEDILGE